MNAKFLALVLLGLLVGAADQPARLPSRPIDSVFYIEKSENRNQVHYAVQVDARCRPLGDAPVRGYWRELEDGPNVVLPLQSHEHRAYGLDKPRAITRTDRGGDVRISMRALPDRILRISTFEQDGACRARVFTPIKGHAAVLSSIYVKIGFLFSIDYLLLRGVRASDGVRIEERIKR